MKDNKKMIQIEQENNIMENTEEKSFWNKIKQFFSDIFGKNNKTKNFLPESVNNEEKELESNNEFTMELKVPLQQKDIHIIQLQKDFEDGKIKEEDISKQDKAKLIQLYKEQIEALEKSIESYKNKILKIKK